MDSIFDCNIAPSELATLGIILNEEEYKASTSMIKKFYDLHALFVLRGDENKAHEIIIQASSILNLTNTNYF